ncbi:MAG TPA: pantoate--beta-alanine ligase [Methylotenera sp.]|nr:pantoate--beta-alanine ligase [Methylotenera sp.]HPH05516.1 pantoate--beta-alanine ligase [Methylotenera sp.]HPN00070.1 pantoate--beta-alanine ligase [Methylotenera sp.]
MQIIHTISELRTALKQQPKIGFVPTMGNLHAGHIHLVEIAKQNASCVVVSIFVNPLQFGANEDFGSYPRTLEADCEKLKAAGADIVFAPNVSEMYPQVTENKSNGKNLNQSMTITPPPIASELCGASRPGHFAGVATVVMKLFNMVQPQIAVFGKKDFQQLFIIKEMVKQFNLPIQIIAGETMREASGLAMSSRNGYLNEAQRTQSAQLNAALQHIAQQLKNGHQDFTSLEKTAAQQLNQNHWEVDYISIRSANTLQPAQAGDKQLVVLGAAKISNNLGGKTRLIDNLEVHI